MQRAERARGQRQRCEEEGVRAFERGVESETGVFVLEIGSLRQKGAFAKPAGELRLHALSSISWVEQRSTGPITQKMRYVVYLCLEREARGGPRL